MSSAKSDSRGVELTVENIGGIDQTAIEFEPGVTVLSGRNATNRTSLLQAVMAALGSENASLKGDADRGRVELSMGDERHVRELRREDGTVHMSGDPFLDDPTLADLFAFLLESNEARRAIEFGGDLRDIITRPVDTEAIQAEIDELVAEKREVDSELEELQRYEQRLPELEQRKTTLQGEIAEAREELEAKEEELESRNATVEESREETAEVQELLDELRDTRSKLDAVRFDLETQRESIESLRAERDEFEERQDALSDQALGDVEDLDGEITELRDRRQGIESVLTQLQMILQFNEEMLDGTNPEVRRVLHGGADSSGAVTDQLLDDDETIVCWTCGTEVEEAEVESTLSRLRDLWRDQRARRDELDEDLEGLVDEKNTLDERRRERENVERQLDRIDDEIEEREERIEELESRRSELEDAADQLESAVEARESDEFDEILALHKEVNRLDLELDRLEGELDDVRGEIDEVESALSSRESLEDRRDEIMQQLTNLRSRVEQIERNAVEQFNDHMETTLELLEYGNVERVWIERTEVSDRGGRRKESGYRFTLHVIRTAESGATYEDTFEHLSESEREVIGLVFALAGFLVHDVHETVPFMLLDSLEAIDSERISSLIEYFQEYVPYLVVALLPEDASVLSDAYQRVGGI